ncbi:MAG TPA: methyltransferase domain-containing protein [Bacteroidota bacterium]|nr:methyltransferase domain-containing protein [Bacteroidota bacterium]
MPRGQCNICGWSGEFLQPSREREGMLCGNCASSSRLRAVIAWLAVVTGNEGLPLHAWGKNAGVAILESSARGSYPVMLQDKFDYFATEYDPGEIAGGKHPRRFADFQDLHYADGTFDVVIASDVFEHVRDDEAGYREVFRTLKPGGTLILTVPYMHEQPATVRRVDTSGPTDVLLMEPEYHGGGGHTLTYRTYGRDLLSLLKSVGFSVAHSRTCNDALGITPQSVIVAQKGAFLEIPYGAAKRPGAGSLGPLIPYRLFLLLKYNFAGFTRIVKNLGRT